MWDSMRQLLRAQAVDAEIWRLRAAMRDEPAMLAEREAAVREAEARCAAARDIVVTAQKRIDARNLELREKEADVRRLDGQMNTATTNREYQTFQREILNRRSDISKIEDEILGLMEKVEEVRKAEFEVKAAADTVRAERDRCRGVVEADLERIRGRLEELEGRRREAVAGLEPDVLRLYDRLLASREGAALAAVEGLMCGGCHVSMTLQNQGRLLAGEKVQCGSCQRLLYIPELWKSGASDA